MDVLQVTDQSEPTTNQRLSIIYAPVPSEPTTDQLLQSTIYAPWQYMQIMLHDEADSSGEAFIKFLFISCGGPTCYLNCTDASTIFGDWRATWNCLTLATVSQTRRNVSDSADKELMASIDEEIYDLYGVNMTSFDGTSVLEDLYDCAQASCRNEGDSCDLAFPSIQEALEDSFFSWPLYMGNYFCLGARAEANPDIAGPGIYVALMSQNAIAFYACLVSLCICSRAIIARLTSSYPRLDKSLLRLEKTNFSHATFSFAADFSEAQSFFVITIAIAIIYGDNQDASFNGAHNWLSVNLNRHNAFSLSWYTPIPITITQVVLGLTAMDSIYSLVLSTTAMVLAVVASVLTQSQPDVSRVRDMLTKDKTIVRFPECGNNPSLRAFCGTNGNDGPSIGEIDPPGLPLVWPWLVLLGFLWYFKLRHRLRSMARLQLQHLQQRAQGSTAKTRTLLFLGRMVWLFEAFLIRFALPVTLLILLFMTITVLASIQRDIKDSSSSGSNLSWTLGQVVALLVWVPVLSKYFYTLIFGVENGFQIRLSKSYTVRKDVERYVAVDTTRDPSSGGLELS
ncbi:uncharacterized protein F5Z01DRAFT_753379 [Emericellopsis atlantica]|uniref:Uncharacterized protein n=1 Tax=Emericellopsis atlantica TaxID=2614577 RepID=A0A9P7ZFG3_9HYPO|nr:uncharacterized protein F5Z01DRAFT_753379 [Emericellopsis atlantica]KAG9250697.1 hypothetical protein F5Z01DRAFT_753379 [Emericellopsis atlantica]